MAVVVTSRAAVPLFFLQARAVSAEVEDPRVDTPYPLTLATQQSIGYCPGCGTCLRERYDQQLDALRRDDLVLGS